MNETHERVIVSAGPAMDIATYELRVKGRLDSEYWAQWFEGMTITVTDGGETIIRGPVTDQAALYGILARLRDLAVPLLSVTIIDPEGQSRRRPGRKRGLPRINWLLVLIFLLVSGGLSSLTVFLAEEILDTALTLALLFGALGGITYAFSVWDGGWAWRATSALAWIGAVITFTIYLMTQRWLHPALGISMMLLAAAGTMLYILYRVRGHNIHVEGTPVQRWDKLGHIPEQTGSEETDLAEHNERSRPAVDRR